MDDSNFEDSFVGYRKKQQAIIDSDSDGSDTEDQSDNEVVGDSFDNSGDNNEHYNTNTSIKSFVSNSSHRLSFSSNDDDIDDVINSSKSETENDKSCVNGNHKITNKAQDSLNDSSEHEDEESHRLSHYKTEENDDDVTSSVTNNTSSKTEQVDANIKDTTGTEEDFHNFTEEDSDDSAVKAIEKSWSIVEVSSDEDHSIVFKQSNQKPHPSKPTIKTEIDDAVVPTITKSNEHLQVTQEQYESQKIKISEIQADLSRTQRVMRTIVLESLPDKGKLMIDKEKYLTKILEEETVLLNMMKVEGEATVSVKDKIEIGWKEIEAGFEAVAPRTLGAKGIARFNAEKYMAVETLDSLHKSLETCPTENDFLDDPRGLKVPLMPHQKRALAWLIWREKQKPSGGILADDMGLGKTLTMISLIIKSREIAPESEEDKEKYRDKYPGGTLVVCPASLLNQWSGEVENRTKRGLLSVEVYHGAKRETKPKRLAKHDMVITTYSIVMNEYGKEGTVFGVRWRRIVLDEAHQIRNHKSQTSQAVCNLSGKSRWALTGTPVHNKELDMYALLKFLRCSPFDDLQVWKHWVSDKSTGGQMRLHAVISSLMLRRTKAELASKGVLKSLPDRKWELIAVTMDKDEMNVYQKILIFSRTLFAQFLHQRAEKNQDAYDLKFGGAPPDPNGEYFKMRNRLLKLNKVKNVSQHEILVLLLRLRQICCHPSLITQMLHGDEDLGDAEDEEESEEVNLLEMLNKLDINNDEDHVAGLSEECVGLKEATKGYLNPSHPVFLKDRPSSKIKALVPFLKEKVSNGDKAIVVSQWTTLLKLIAVHVSNERIGFAHLDGSVPVNKRMAIVDDFNDPNSNTKVLLLSLTAGGVGLNLVGANHLFLLDLHWNPQLENQAQDRIYRMGQNKPVYVYKFMATGTIEERIKALQDRKLEIADAVMTGSKKVTNSKLTLNDLKLLFDFKC